MLNYLHKPDNKKIFPTRDAFSKDFKFISRLDRQIKISGFRIELEELESVVRAAIKLGIPTSDSDV